MSIRLLQGDCREVLATLDAGSIDACVTDPPYHLGSMVKRLSRTNAADVAKNFSKTVEGQARSPYAALAVGFMGKTWDGGDVAFRPETWVEVLRVLKPGAYLAAFASTRGYHRMVCAIEDAGFIIHPMLAWINGQGFPKAHKVDDPAWAGWAYGLQSLKPCVEPICLAQKPFSEKTGTANVQRWGTGALNIDACRVTSVIEQRPNGGDTWASDQNLCGSCAEDAGSRTKPQTPATRASIATKPAGLPLSARGETSPPDTSKTDTGCSDGMMAACIVTNSSIGVSGKMPTGLFPQDTKSTTTTRIEATTGSTTCCSCGSSITCNTTSANTPAAKKNSPQGREPSVSAGRDGEPSASRRYTNNGGTNFAATPGPRGGDAAGRWPPNVCHDGSDEVLEAFARFGERTSGSGAVKRASSADHFGNRGSAYGAESRPAGTAMISHADTGTAARFFYEAKASREERGEGNNHPTVKPLALMRWLCRLITPPGGTVLDPFLGSGSTAIAANQEGSHCIGIEQSAEYLEIARRRLATEAPLFTEVA